MLTSEAISKGSVKNILSFTFYLLLITSMVSYIGYYFYFLREGINVFALYYADQLSYKVGILAKFIRYLKDLLVVFLFAELLAIAFTHNIKKNVPVLIISMLIIYGIFVSLFRNRGIWYIISGIRPYFYLLTILIFFSLSFSELKLRTIYRLCLLSLLVSFIVGLEQTYRGTGHNILLAGKQNYRFTGLFGSSWGWGSFLIAFTILLFISYKKLKLQSRTILVLILLIILSSIMTGSRSSMINLLVIIVTWVLNALHVDEHQKQAVILCGILVTIPIAIIVASGIASRGSILRVQLESGRLNILKNIFTNSTSLEIIFGHGIGEGSNSNVMLVDIIGSTKRVILDGTFNVLFYQFGIIGIVPIILMVILGIYKMVSKSSKSYCILFICTVVLQSLTLNIFESYSFLIIIAVNYALMTKNECFDLT